MSRTSLVSFCRYNRRRADVAVNGSLTTTTTGMATHSILMDALTCTAGYFYYGFLSLAGYFSGGVWKVAK